MSIEVYLQDKNDFINKFNKKELNSELGEYIFNRSLVVKDNKKESIIIKLETDFKITKQDKDNMIDQIRSYYGHQIKGELVYLKSSYIKNSILLIIGVILITISYILQSFSGFLLPEIFLIAGWVSIWEMAYSLLFSNNKHRLRIKMLKKLTNCYIEIESKDSQKL